MQSIEIVKVEAPYGYESRHLWAVMLGSEKVAEIVPDFRYDFANAISTASAKRETIGYTVFGMDEEKVYEVEKSHDPITGHRVGLRSAFNGAASMAYFYADAVRSLRASGAAKSKIAALAAARISGGAA